MKYIDLHTHSNASDGSDSPTELVRRAHEANLAAIALTDHDTTDGLDEALRAGREFGVRVIPGCELSTATPAGEVHILGLWLPADRSALETYLERLRKARQNRNLAMLAKLRAQGLDISMEEVQAKARGSVCRPHIAAALVDRGYAKNAREAFALYIGQNGSAWVPKENPAPEEACRTLSDLGATVVFAHPFLENRSFEWVDELAGRLRNYGLDAIETWHTVHNEEHEKMAMEIAARHDLLLSGGSDYHGTSKPGIFLGTGYGTGRDALAVPEEILWRLEERRKARGLAC